MKKTKIAFEDIQAGDLLEVVHKADGVKSVDSGIAFEYEADYISGHGAWFTSESGLLVVDGGNDTVYRVEPAKECTFDDIQKGDMVRLTKKSGGSTLAEIRMGIADTQVFYEGKKSYWLTPGGDLLIHWLDRDREIEILDRD